MASKADVDRWRALADAATDGPWVDEFSPEGAQVVPVNDGSGYICHPAGDEDGRLEPNMAFIAASREAVPAMADMLAECMSMIATMPQPRPKWADDLLREWQGEADDDES
jgi:hypothetical protein